MISHRAASSIEAVRQAAATIATRTSSLGASLDGMLVAERVEKGL